MNPNKTPHLREQLSLSYTGSNGSYEKIILEILVHVVIVFKSSSFVVYLFYLSRKLRLT